MKKLNSILIGLMLLTFLTACNEVKKTEPVNKPQTILEEPAESMAERGEYLVKIIGCDHCHTPKKMTENGPVPDMDKWLMGYPAESQLAKINKAEIEPGKWLLFNGDLTAAVGPWGVSFSANLTPDETGIGNWTYENFKKAMTEGKYKGLDDNRMLLPPMPWQSYTEMKEDDLKAIFEYLKTIKPISNLVPQAIPPTDL